MLTNGPVDVGFNNNIRCIEIAYAREPISKKGMFNNNIRCIEI